MDKNLVKPDKCINFVYEDMNRIWTFLTLNRNMIQHKFSSLYNVYTEEAFH